MLRFKQISPAHTDRDLRIKNGFMRRLAVESARLGTEIPRFTIPDEDGFSVQQRYAPMHRLLTEDDQLFLKAQGTPAPAKRLRREHRKCYFGFVTRLAQEVRTARRLRVLAMASKENWSFWILLAHVVFSESSLLYLRWLGCRHALGITVAARDVKECLDLLLVGPKFDPVTT